MLRLSDEQAQSVAAAVAAARGRPDLHAAVADVYRRVQAEIDARKPVCAVSGRCCRFEEYGHRLFVTTVELAVFADEAPALPARGGGDSAAWDETGCPFQTRGLYGTHGLCGAHAARPFGCRIYFCDATSTEWQQTLYERFHDELKALHGRAGVPYFYVEWREGLRATGVAEPGTEQALGSPVRLSVTRLAQRTQD